MQSALDTSKEGLSWLTVRAVAAPAGDRSAFWLRCMTCLFGLLVGLGVSWRVLVEPGWIGFVHDWSIAPFPEQHLALLRQTFDGWYRWGLGFPVAYPFEYPLRLAFGVAASAGLSGGAIGKAVVLFVPALSFVAATYLGRACRLPYGAAWLCGAFYALDPVMLNKLVTGQAAYLIGYAFLPLAPALFIRASQRGHPLIGGVAIGGVLALIAMEVQLGVLAAALVVLLALFSSTVSAARRLAITASAVAVLIVIESPTLVGVAHGFSGLARLDQFGHGAAWLGANSLAPAAAIRLIGYLAQYDVLSVGSWMGVWQPASWVVVAVACAGLIVLPGPMRPTLLVAGAAALLFACGTTTPLGPAIRWAFERFASAQVFRELYHVMALVSLAYAVGIGAAFAFAARLRFARAIQAVVLGAVAIYVAPMLSGDVSGWLTAVPVDRYLASAFHAENEGEGRVAWFPMDEPLAFDGRGSGVDPMSVSSRGSLWMYSLAWPLTAVDAAARSGDLVGLRRDLRALGVSDAIERDRLHSRYRSLSRVADLADRFFGSDLNFGPALGAVSDEGAGVRAFEILDPVPIVRTVTRYALVPRRLSVIADASLGGAAAFGFAQKHPPPGVPYDAYSDLGDRSWEALQVGGLTRPAPERRVDPFTGFAGGDLWWWYRPQYADARRFRLAIGRATTVVATDVPLRDARLVVAWIATPAGGELQVRCGGASRTLDTGGSWGSWRSAVVSCGPLPAGGRAVLFAPDAGAEIALRGTQLVDAGAYHVAQGRLAAVLRGASQVIGLGEPVSGPGRFLRSGRSPLLGSLPPGTPAVLEVERRSPAGGAPAVRIDSVSGFPLAWRRFRPGARRLYVPLVAGRDGMRLGVGAEIIGWRLVALRRAAGVARANPEPQGPARLLIADDTFDDGWRADGSVAHLSSALGTNVFVFPHNSANAAALRYAYATAFHTAYFFGALILSLALAVGLTFALNPDAPAAQEPASRVSKTAT
jgi:hypothetical protein